MTAQAGDEPVEQYLDELFDRLAGTGPAGRRMLAEAEGHLLAAVQEGRARGLDAEAAERAAIERFGTVPGIAHLVPVAAGDVRGASRRLLVGTWIVVAVTMAWYGLSGVVTWLLGWPWTRLLIATDRFGTQHDMCGRPWVSSDPGVDCFTQYRHSLDVVPAGGDRFPYLSVAAAGVLLLATLLVLRRHSVLGTRAWTPKTTVLGLGLAVPFGLAAAVLVFYGVIGLGEQAQNWAPSYLLTGLLAAGISVTALHRVRTSSSARSAAAGG